MGDFSAILNLEEWGILVQFLTLKEWWSLVQFLT
jgi:hypothetical protein